MSMFNEPIDENFTQLSLAVLSCRVLTPTARQRATCDTPRARAHTPLSVYAYGVRGAVQIAPRDIARTSEDWGVEKSYRG